MRHCRAVFGLLLGTLIGQASASVAETSISARLGRIEFNVNALAPARGHFLRGMLAMHSFWYEEARSEFQAATKNDPTFALGYWGEALTYYHPVWGEENLVGARAAMGKIPADARLAARDDGLISAARILFGAGTTPTRWEAYADSLQKLHRRFDHDDEVATLWAVAVLGNAYRVRTSAPSQPNFRLFAEAGAAALEVLRHNPQHPGAAHYVIHAFDDPEHAILALPAARLYADIAPQAAHAQHMPSHIFVQLGMWSEAAASNEAAWAASRAWVHDKQLDTSYHDFHSLSWLMSIALEQGQRRRAKEILMRGFESLRDSHDPDRMPLLVGEMAGEYVLKTSEWEEMDKLLAPLGTVRKAITTSAEQLAMPGCPGHAEASASRAGLVADAWLAFLHGEAAAFRKDAAALARSRRALAVVTKKINTGQNDPDVSRQWKIRGLALAGRAGELAHSPNNVIRALHEAVAVEESVPAVGPAQDILARERLGEYLLLQNQPALALEEFRKVLVTHPGRARSLLGAARASKEKGDLQSSRESYRELARVWDHADADPALEEVRSALP